MHLNVKFLQILFIIYISFESINSGDSNKIIPIFLISKIQFFELETFRILLKHIFASTTTTKKNEKRKSTDRM